MKQRWRANNPIKAAYVQLRDNAKRRRKIFTLTLEEFTSFCMATTYLDEKGRERHCLTIDRIDWDEGYHLWNLQVLTHKENSEQGADNAPRHERSGPPDPDNEPF